jgi:hypothetical protein
MQKKKKKKKKKKFKQYFENKQIYILFRILVSLQ